MSARASTFKAPEMATIMQIISCADRAIQEDGSARTADQAMRVLEKTVDKLKAVTKPVTSTSSVGPGLCERSNSFDSLTSDTSTITDAGSDFTFIASLAVALLAVLTAPVADYFLWAIVISYDRMTQ
jgi:hypothetical protein